MIYKIKNYIIQANEVVFSTLLAGSITLVYHWYYLKTFLPFLDNKKLVEFRLPVRDGDYYLLTIERLADVFRSINPFTDSAITPQLNLHFAELVYFIPYSLGLSIESSYLIIQVLFTGLLLFTLSRFALNILQVKWIVTLFTSAFTFLVFPEVFVRPVSPTIHATFLFLYLYLVWITLMKQSQSRPLLTNLFGLIVGIGYPYFALWATLWSLFLAYLYLSQKNREFSVLRFVKIFLTLWLATAVNLTSTLFLGHHLDTHATTYLHFPTGYLRLIVSVGVILLILVLKKRNLTDTEKFLIASLFAPVAFLLSPTLTGRELEFNSHITFPYSYWMLLAMFYIIVKIWSMKFKGSKFALVVLIFAFLVTENSQMPLQDRFRASYTARTLIARENIGQLTIWKNELPNLFTNQGVTSIPSELVSLLYGTPNFKVLSHPYAGFDENDRKETIERYILNQQLQQSQVSVVYNNRELFGTRILNQCNRFRNFSKIVGFAGFTFDSSRACEISPNDLEQIREVEANISRGLLSYMKKYDVNFIISSSSTSLQKYPFKYEILFRTRDYVLLQILPFDR